MNPAYATSRAAVPGLVAVYLFGSAAEGEAHAGSDTDVDLVDLAAASTVMRAQVVGSGRVLYDADPTARQHFEVRTLSAYALLNEERAGILRDVRARGRVYG